MIVEFAGLPRSGKSVTIGTVRDYFLRSGHMVKMSPEGARSCPFGSHYRVEFACWTANQALTAVLEGSLNIKQAILLLQDRGLFDALAFFKLLHLEDIITDETLTDFINYFANPKWTRLVKLVILFEISPEEALDRDIASKLSAGPGIVTNITTMRKLSVAYNYVIEHYGDRFPQIVQLDTTKTDPLETARRAIQFIKDAGLA